MPPIARAGAFKIAEDYLKARPRPNCDGIKLTLPDERVIFMTRAHWLFLVVPEVVLVGLGAVAFSRPLPISCLSCAAVPGGVS